MILQLVIGVCQPWGLSAQSVLYSMPQTYTVRINCKPRQLLYKAEENNLNKVAHCKSSDQRYHPNPQKKKVGLYPLVNKEFSGSCNLVPRLGLPCVLSYSQALFCLYRLSLQLYSSTYVANVRPGGRGLQCQFRQSYGRVQQRNSRCKVVKSFHHRFEQRKFSNNDQAYVTSCDTDMISTCTNYYSRTPPRAQFP